MFNLQFGPAIERLDSAVATFRERCPGSRWEVATARYYSFISQFFGCRFLGMREAQETALKEAVESGDRYASVMLRVGTVNRSWLLAGDSVRARRELEAASREWPEEPFHVIHFYALISSAYVELYDGYPERALERFRATRQAVRKSMLLEFEGPRLDYTAVYGRTLVAVALAATRAGKTASLREVERCIRISGQRPHPMTHASTTCLRAGCAAVRDDRAGALALLDEVARGTSEDVWLAAQTSRWVAAKMRNVEAEVAAAADELASRGVKVGVPLVRGQLPGLERYL
jgi:hypothetical protein